MLEGISETLCFKTFTWIPAKGTSPSHLALRPDRACATPPPPLRRINRRPVPKHKNIVIEIVYPPYSLFNFLLSFSLNYLVISEVNLTISPHNHVVEENKPFTLACNAIETEKNEIKGNIYWKLHPHNGTVETDIQNTPETRITAIKSEGKGNLCIWSNVKFFGSYVTFVYHKFKMATMGVPWRLAYFYCRTPK